MKKVSAFTLALIIVVVFMAIILAVQQSGSDVSIIGDGQPQTAQGATPLEKLLGITTTATTEDAVAISVEPIPEQAGSTTTKRKTTPPVVVTTTEPVVKVPDESGEETTSATATTTTTTTTAATTTTTAATEAATTTTAAKELGTAVIKRSTCNIRSDAGASYKLLKTAKKGESYPVTGSKNAANDVPWLRITLEGGQVGYVCASFCTYNGSALPTEATTQSTVKNGRAYLTFDDGPSDNTKKILDILDKKGVKATFFVIYRKGYDSVYKDIVKRGHTIAIHSYTHDYGKIYKSEKAYFSDINKLSDYIEELTGVRSKYLRFPGGASNTVSRKHCKGIMSTLTASVTAEGYRYYDWNVDSGDADGNKIAESKIIKNVKSRVGNMKDVMLLMHDAPPKTTTVDALPEIIDFLKGKGYSILPIDGDAPEVHQKVAN